MSRLGLFVGSSKVFVGEFWGSVNEFGNTTLDWFLVKYLVKEVLIRFWELVIGKESGKETDFVTCWESII